MTRPYLVTEVLVVLTTLVFVAMQVLRLGQAETAAVIYEFGGIHGQALRMRPWELWRFVTPIFVHIGFEHFIMNMLTLYFLGRQLESLLGRWIFLIIYLLSGIMGNIFVFLFTPNNLAAGASTALFGLFAILAVLRYFVNNTYLSLLGQQYMLLLVLNLVGGLFHSGISLAGHLGGAVGGALCALFLPTRLPAKIPRSYSLLALGAYLLFLCWVGWILF